MDELEHLKRSIWRRALLLTGDRDGAERVLARVLSVADDPRKLAAHRRERLTLQAAREWIKRRRPAHAARGTDTEPLELEGPARQLWQAVGALPRQPAEAWMLRDVEQLTDIDAARAMDCSRTALGHHRQAAVAALAPLMGAEFGPSMDGLRQALARADAGPAMLAVEQACLAARRRRRLVSLAQVLALLACMGVLVWVAVDLFRANDRERERRDMDDVYSLPIQPEPAPTTSAPTKPPAGAPR